jgi:hypothetical protein
MRRHVSISIGETILVAVSSFYMDPPLRRLTARPLSGCATLGAGAVKANPSLAPIAAFVRAAFGTIAGLALNLRSRMQNSQATRALSPSETGTVVNDAATARVIAAYLEHANDDVTGDHIASHNVTGDNAADDREAASEGPSADAETSDVSVGAVPQVNAQQQIANLQHEVSGTGSALHSALFPAAGP